MRIALMLHTIFMLALFASGAGCATREHIPTYPLMPPAQTLQALHDRSVAIRSVSGEGSLRLTRDDGQSIILDAVVVLRPADQARVRAWKFGRAVFDLTLTPNDVYLVAPKDSAQRQQITAAGSRVSGMIRTWLRLASGSFNPIDIEEHADALVVSRNEPDGTKLVCTIDRRTITARSYRVLDQHGTQRFSLTLSNYIESNGQVWPRRIDALSQSGALRLDLYEVDVNGELSESAFTPPARAEKLP